MSRFVAHLPQKLAEEVWKIAKNEIGAPPCRKEGILKGGYLMDDGEGIRVTLSYVAENENMEPEDFYAHLSTKSQMEWICSLVPELKSMVAFLELSGEGEASDD